MMFSLSSWAIVSFLRREGFFQPLPPHASPLTAVSASLGNPVHDRIQGWAWTHRCCRFPIVGMIVPSHIDRPSLRTKQLSGNLGLIVCQLLGDFGKTRLKVLILRLLGQSLRPVQR